MKAIGYTRVSTEQQAESGLSLEGQRAKLRSYADLHDYDLVDIHEDAGESGKDLERDGLQTALDALESGEADCLIVYKVNRLSRHVGDMQDLIEGYFGEGADHDLAAVSDHVDTTTATGRMMLNILMSVDQGERERIAERTREALELKRERGEYTGGKVPFGFEVDADGNLQPEPREQQILRDIRALRRDGMTLADIAEELNRREVERRNGNEWHQPALSRVLNSEFRRHDPTPETQGEGGAARDDDDGLEGGDPTSCDVPHNDETPDPMAAIRELREQGLSLREVADTLNERGIERPNGNDWHHVAVSRALDD